MIAAAFALWIELLMREAAVYVIVLLLPLAFAAMVWPARRIWAVRAVELLVGLILSKFVIVAVLSLGGAAISASAGQLSIAGVMAGAVLVTLAAFAPWALMRLVPLAELATGAAGALRTELRPAGAALQTAGVVADDWSAVATAAMRRAAGERSPDPGPAPAEAPAPPPGDARGGAGGAPASGGGDDPRGGGDDPAGGDADPRGGGDDPRGGGDDPAGGDADPSAEDASDEPVFDWSRMPELELGPDGISSTPVWPNEAPS
jgi:hypothetical protein